ncbi:MAG: hypothetical protein ABW220_08660 [Burkholderiaceae bacterium]
MNPPFKRDYLQHALALGRWLRDRQASGAIDPLNQVASVSVGAKQRRLHPRFVVEHRDGRVSQTRELAENVGGFVGWLPYIEKTWQIADDRIAFKEFAEHVGLATPRWVLDPADTRGNFVVKARWADSGLALRGPFAPASPIALADGEYCEEFVVGQLLKAIYWNKLLVVVELAGMPAVHGDGERTLRQLVAARLTTTDRWPKGVERLAAIQGLTLDSVVAAEREVVVDHRHLSPLNIARGVDHDVRWQIRGSALESQLLEAGARCWKAIPIDRRDETMFALDAVVDTHGRVWFLGMDCNPQLHPGCYAPMLDAMFFGPARAIDAGERPRPGTPRLVALPNVSTVAFARSTHRINALAQLQPAPDMVVEMPKLGDASVRSIGRRAHDPHAARAAGRETAAQVVRVERQERVAADLVADA